MEHGLAKLSKGPQAFAAILGYPEAHDNDAERAVRSGLAILGALAQLNEDAVHPKLSAPIGIDSGPAVVGTGAGPEADVFGDRPNIAARVQVSKIPFNASVTPWTSLGSRPNPTSTTWTLPIWSAACKLTDGNMILTGAVLDCLPYGQAPLPAG
jgi:hypothetical protein